MRRPPARAARAVRSLNQATGYADSVKRPYLHLVDGGVTDNLGLRGAAGKIIMASPEFQRLLKDLGASVVTGPAGAPPAPADASPR